MSYESYDLYRKCMSFKRVKRDYPASAGTEHGVSDKVDLNGAFCSGNCVNGVCVTVDGELFSLKPETTDDFFAKEILGRL